LGKTPIRPFPTAFLHSDLIRADMALRWKRIDRLSLRQCNDIMISPCRSVPLSERPVAQLVVRDLESDIKARLKSRAARHGRSLEAEVSDILRDAVKDDDAQGPGLGTRAASRFASLRLKEDELSELPRRALKPANLTE
jgi:plasmid stability protein